MASPARRNRREVEAPAPVLNLTDHILADILIRLPEPADLGRASAACPAFRRVIADHSFLRRFRVVHPPPLLGMLAKVCGPNFLPAELPHPSAAAARAFADAADFTYSFLPSPDRWRCHDIRDGRVLLFKVPERQSIIIDTISPGSYNPRIYVQELAVCDVLHRRYLLLPAIPDDLAALVNERGMLLRDPFLAPPSSEVEGDASFRVICLAYTKMKLVVFSFSSGGGQWHAGEFDGWSALAASPANSSPFSDPLLSRRYYAHKCFCWKMHERNKLLVLDVRTMEFSSVDIPPARNLAIVEAGEGRFGMITPGFDRESKANVLLYKVLRNDGHGANQWHSEANIRMPLNYRCIILGAAGGYLLLLGFSEYVPDLEKRKLQYFSLNLKNFQIERFCDIRPVAENALLYAGFPPSLSPPTI